MVLAGKKDITVVGPTFQEWNAELCECKAARKLLKTEDTITVKDPISLQFTTLSKDYTGGNVVYLKSLTNVNVGVALSVGTDAPKLVTAIGQKNAVTLSASLSKVYPEGTTVTSPQRNAQVRVYVNLPYASIVKIRRKNDPRGFYTTNELVGADGSVVIRQDVALFGATATWGKAYGNITETVEVVPKDTLATSYKACFFYGLVNPTLCPQ